MISSFIRALISAFKARRELVPADELNRRHTLIRLDFIEQKSERSVMPQDTGVGRNGIANALSWLDRIKAGKTYEEIALEDAIPTRSRKKASTASALGATGLLAGTAQSIGSEPQSTEIGVSSTLQHRRQAGKMP